MNRSTFMVVAIGTAVGCDGEPRRAEAERGATAAFADGSWRLTVIPDDFGPLVGPACSSLAWRVDTESSWSQVTLTNSASSCTSYFSLGQCRPPDAAWELWVRLNPDTALDGSFSVTGDAGDNELAAGEAYVAYYSAFSADGCVANVRLPAISGTVRVDEEQRDEDGGIALSIDVEIEGGHRLMGSVAVPYIRFFD